MIRRGGRLTEVQWSLLIGLALGGLGVTWIGTTWSVAAILAALIVLSVRADRASR